jgi:hypothetical protein
MSIKIMKLYWYLNKFGDYEKDILSFFYKSIKKHLLLFMIKKRSELGCDFFVVKVGFY